MLKASEHSFSIDSHLITLINDEPFFTELSRQMTKYATDDMPTAGVSYDVETDQIVLYYNPAFMASLSNAEIRGVLFHEFYHLVFGHLTARRRTPHNFWNIATDLAINSIILGDGKVAQRGRLPEFVLVPGRWPIKKENVGKDTHTRERTKEEKDAEPLAALIASMPKNKASEYYFSKIMELAQEMRKNGKSKGQKGGIAAPGEGDPSDEKNDDVFGESWIDSLDDHSGWDKMSDEQREYVNGKVKAMVEKAMRKADETATGWGSIPAELREDIRKSISTIINWRQVLRQFIGTMIRGGRSTSIKRINRRYPYIHPGMKRGYMAKLLIARDESGSVSNEMLAMFFAELNSLTRKVEIDFLPFDCGCDPKDIVRWNRGQVPEKATKRTRAGGTDFNAPTDLFNDPKNRGRWDGLLILTDGMAPSPKPLRGKRGWVLAEGCKLEFKSEELQISLTKEAPMTGAWR